MGRLCFVIMVSLLSKPEFQRRALPLSVQAWHGLVDAGLAPKRAELLRGVIVEKMPKSILHIKLAGRLWNLLQTLLTTGFWVRKEDPLTFGDSEPEPDVSVVRGAETDYRTHPSTAVLVVEVSISTLTEDREMAAIYAEAGVEEFWIVNGLSRCIEIYGDPRGGSYHAHRTVHLREVAVCGSLPGVAVNLDELFADLPEGLLPANA